MKPKKIKNISISLHIYICVIIADTNKSANA